MNFRTLILLFVIVLYSCQNKQVDDLAFKKICNNISNYYSIANDKSQHLDDRQFAIDEAYKTITKEPKDTCYYKVLYKKSLIHYSKKEFDSLLHYTTLLLAQTEVGENYYRGKANYLKANYLHTIQYMPDSALYYYNKSKNNFLSISDSSEVGRRLLNMSYIQKNCSDYFGSKETITEALQFLNEQKDTKYIASAYNVLAFDNKKLLNYKDAIVFYKKAIDVTQNQANLQVYKNNLATVYIDTKEYEKGILLLKTILKDTLINKLPKEKARVLDNLAYVRWLKDSIDIENELIEARDIRIKYNDLRGLVASYTHLGEYFSQRNKNKALSWFQKAIQTSKTIKNPRGELDAIRFLMKITPDDISIKSRHIQLNDSLQQQELKVKTQFAKMRYDDRLKSEEIQKLKVLMAQQQLEVSIQRTQKITYLLTGIILVLMIGFFVHYLVQKHRKEKEKEVYKAEKRISKRIHDELANDISHLTSFVEKTEDISSVPTKEILENKLQNIYLRARDISIETASVDVDNFKQELMNLIQQYNTSDVNVITNVSEFEWIKIPDYKKIAIYRVLQEFFINAKKHSSCTRITLMTKDGEKRRTITYTDNGVGCDISNIKTNGLVNAENRMENIKGKLTFETSPGKGFRAALVFPK